jgi:hypothetical protein
MYRDKGKRFTWPYLQTPKRRAIARTILSQDEKEQQSCVGASYPKPTSTPLRGLALTKSDNRNKPPKDYGAVECEALGQMEIVNLYRDCLIAMLRRLGLEPIEAVRVREAAALTLGAVIGV